jgi:hypothetical protein
MALICVSQQSRPPAATTASSAEPTAATEGVHHRHRHRHHHRHKDAGCRRRSRHSSRRGGRDGDSSPSSRNRIRPLETADGGSCSGLADRTADRKAAGAESEEEEGLDVMAAEQLVEDCDSGCECGPEEAEGRRT